MVKNSEKIVLKCKAVGDTKRYSKYRLPDELYEDEEPNVLFSGRHIYIHKSDENESVRQVVVELKGQGMA